VIGSVPQGASAPPRTLRSATALVSLSRRQQERAELIGSPIVHFGVVDGYVVGDASPTRERVMRAVEIARTGFEPARFGLALALSS
jgi:hypothetical protein